MLMRSSVCGRVQRAHSLSCQRLYLSQTPPASHPLQPNLNKVKEESKVHSALPHPHVGKHAALQLIHIHIDQGTLSLREGSTRMLPSARQGNAHNVC